MFDELEEAILDILSQLRCNSYSDSDLRILYRLLNQWSTQAKLSRKESQEFLISMNRLARLIFNEDDISLFVQLLEKRHESVTQHGDRNINIGNAKDIQIVNNHLNSEHQKETLHSKSSKRSNVERILIKRVKSQLATLAKYFDIRPQQLINIEKFCSTEKVMNEWLEKHKEKQISSPYESLPEEKSILDFFLQEDVAGRFLILGSPGSGKTILLFQLAQELINQAESNNKSPIPLFFDSELEACQRSYLSIYQWMINQVFRKYGIPLKETKELFRNHKLVLLFDNLDWLSLSERRKFITDINNLLIRFYSPPEYIVLCCRTDEYDICHSLLRLSYAISLKPLSYKKINQYLEMKNLGEVWKLVKDDKNIMELLETPLLLSMFSKMFEHQEDKSPGFSIEIWKKLYSDKKEEIYHYLFDGYAEKFIENKQHRYWLKILAMKLKQKGTQEFLIEKMQPELWLKEKILNRHYYWITYLLLNFLMFWYVLGILILVNPCIQCILFRQCSYSDIDLGLVVLSLDITVIATLLIVVICGSKIRPVETLKFPWGTLKETFQSIGFIERTVGAIISNLGVNLARINHDFLPKMEEKQTHHSTSFVNTNILITIFNRLLIGVLGYLVPPTSPIRGIGGVIRGLHGRDLEPHNRSFPNKGIYKSGLNAIFYAIIIGVISASCGFVLVALISMSMKEVFSSDIRHVLILKIGVACGLLGALVGSIYAGFPCIQHFSLRLALYLHGYIPWNYAKFLDSCVKNGILQRVGSSYRFIHKLLHNYFVAMSLEKKI